MCLDYVFLPPRFGNFQNTIHEDWHGFSWCLTSSSFHDNLVFGNFLLIFSSYWGVDLSFFLGTTAMVWSINDVLSHIGVFFLISSHRCINPLFESETNDRYWITVRLAYSSLFLVDFLGVLLVDHLSWQLGFWKRSPYFPILLISGSISLYGF